MDVFNRLKDILVRSRESRFIVSDKAELPIDKALFSPLSPVVSGRPVILVDGGNGEIAKASDFSLHFARIAFVKYKDNKRVDSSVRECFIIANSLVEGNRLFFRVDCIDARDGGVFDSFRIDARDKALSTGNKLIEPDVAVLHVRKLLELKLLLDLAEKGADCVLVRDGDFEDGPFVEDILSELKRSGRIVFGVSKTSTLLTDSGDAAVEVLLRFGGRGPWVYKADSSFYFVKFHSSSDYVFKVDFLGDPDISVLSELAGMCSDPVFLGYPYGLIAVDALARVSSSFVDIYRALFESVVGVSQVSKNAHDILNKVA